MKKFCTYSKNLLLLLGAGGICYGIFDTSISSLDRFLSIGLGIFICAVVMIQSLRWALICILFFSVGLVGIPNIIIDGNFDEVYFLTVSICFIVSFIFGRKLYKQIYRSRVVHASRFALFDIDRMSGIEFEHFTAQLLKDLGYVNVSITKASGDQGIDVLAECHCLKYGIQCKNYTGKIGNTAVQEAYAGKSFYDCDIAVVLTNSTFTKSAVQLAESIGVMLWDRRTLQEMVHSSRTHAVSIDNLTVPPCADHISDTTTSQILSNNASANHLIPNADDSHSTSSTLNPPIPKKKLSTEVDPSFIVQAQWYAKHSKSNCTDD